ncbi:Structural maintenance of chromosomes protein 3 [Malassezia equina]|uniref:Structural maintenance of chromosomes protein 3 n=1 Tax=Malassezia equina TaxID=1381935 RepID=A0AAF0EM95_9BASI|nr:Structural maintenance of chromosomes protein 3 [Malassezia equina]
MDVDQPAGTRKAPGAGRNGGPKRRGPREMSIKGTSGPTHVIVANVAQGTSLEDVKLTFEPLGRLVQVRRHNMPNLPSNSLAFRMSFESRAAAEAACRKYDGVLADGRVLQVTLEAPPAPAPAQQNRKETMPNVTSRLEEEQLPLPVLRQLAQAEAKYLAETERILSGKGRAPNKAAPTLKDRLGSLPLAQRLAASSETGPRSAAEKMARPSHRRRSKPRKGAARMDVDA